MHVPASRWVALLFLHALPLAARAAAPPPEPGRAARAVLARHCAGCHGEQAKPKGGLGYISDLQRLLSSGAVVAGSPERSPLYQRVRDGEMPPPGKARAFTAADQEVLRRWIAAGAPAGPAPAPLLSPGEVARLVQADLAAQPARQRRFMRYLSLAHLAGDRAATRHAIAKLVNSLSWHPRLTAPAPIADGRILRLDLRDYRWNARQWERLTARYPYAPADDERLVVRADWFVATASRPPTYHDFLSLPSSDRGLERLLQLDVPLNLEEQTAARSGFNGSGVARSNRLLERHDAPHGAYWRSYDFSDNTGRQNLFEYPLGPAPGPAGFKHAGGEIIFHLPNGLQAYLLVDADGRRVDKAPGEIVSDPKRPDRLVENGLSCIGCHVTGILPKDDQIREHVRKNPRAFASEVRDDVFALYPPARRLRALVNEDNARFTAALRRLGVPEGEPEPVLAAVLRYEDTVDRPRALAELGITAEALSARLARSPELARVLGPLLARGGVQRQVFEEMFPRLIESSPTAGIEARAGALYVHRRAVTALAFAPDGGAFASADASGLVCVHELATGRTRELGAHADEVRALAFSPDGRRLLTGGADRTVVLWDVQAGKPIRRLLGHTAGVRAVAFGPNGRWAVSAGEDRALRVWDLDTGKERRSLAGQAGTITAVAVSPNGERIASGGLDRTVRLWRTDTGEEAARFVQPGEVQAVAFSPDGKRLAAGGGDRAVTVRDVESAKVVQQATGLPGTVHVLAFRTNERSGLSFVTDPVAALNRDGRVLVGRDREVRLEPSR